jgi:hypothetical protein
MPLELFIFIAIIAYGADEKAPMGMVSMITWSNF